MYGLLEVCATLLLAAENAAATNPEHARKTAAALFALFGVGLLLVMLVLFVMWAGHWTRRYVGFGERTSDADGPTTLPEDDWWKQPRNGSAGDEELR
jgi:hypothetical protein